MRYKREQYIGCIGYKWEQFLRNQKNLNEANENKVVGCKEKGVFLPIKKKKSSITLN